jgi:hypothetical protein
MAIRGAASKAVWKTVKEIRSIRSGGRVYHPDFVSSLHVGLVYRIM